MSVAAQLRVPQIPELREPHDYQSEARAPTLEALQAAAALAPVSRNDHTKVQANAPEPAAVSAAAAAAAEVPRSRDEQPKAQAAVPEREAVPAAAKVTRSQDDHTKGEAAAPNPEAEPAAAELPRQTKGEAAAPEPEAVPAAAAAKVQRSHDDQTKVQATSPQPEVSAVLEAAVPRSQDDQTEVSGSTFEYGYDAQHGKAWRRVLHGPKKKGPIEWSLPAARDETKGLHDPVTFYFSDGGKYEPGTVTQDTC